MKNELHITDELSEKLDEALPPSIAALRLIKSLIYKSEDMTGLRREIADVIENTDIDGATLKEIVLSKLELDELEHDRLLVEETKKMLDFMEGGLQEEFELYQHKCHEIIMSYNKQMRNKVN